MKKKRFTLFLGFLMILIFAVGAEAKDTVSIMWAEYDGLTPEYAQSLEKAFEEANPDVDLKIISTPWNEFHDRLITFIGGNQAPDLSVIGTRWLLELLDLGVVEPIEQHLSKELVNNIEPASMEGKIGNTLYALPVAIGTRLMYYRSDLISKAPETFEEILEVAQKINKPPDFYAIGMIGQKYVELTEFAYYLFGNGGYFFEINSDGTYGKSTVNSEAGVGALTFMNDLVNKHKVTQPGVNAYKRDEVQNLLLSGKLGIMLSGGFTASLLKQKNVDFKWDVAPMPHFKGKPQSSLLVTDSIVMFKSSKNKKAAAKFLEFFYQDKWRLEFDKLVGFPPVTKSLGKNEFFQTPVYKTMIASTPTAKGWPLIAEWPECNDIIWEAIEATFLGQKQPKAALDEAAAKIDSLRAQKKK
jgi:multiple sugar transport system substrate-binding protein